MALRDDGERGVRGRFHGEFREIVPNERIVSTEVFEGAPDDGGYPDGSDDAAVLTTTTFTEIDGRTTFTQLTECGSKEIRDAIIGSGMEGGMQEAMDKLEQAAVSLG